MRLTFVGAPAGNAFMNELLGAVAHEVWRCGVEAELVFGRFPEMMETAYVVIPHEYFVTVPEGDQPRADQLERTIALCVEQPGTPWFELGYHHARRVAGVVDISVEGVRELRLRGLTAEHFQLGYTEYWDAWKRDESVERSVDVVHLGTATDRRLHALATYASTLWPHEARLLVPPVDPKPEPRPDFVVAAEKWNALRASKVLLNVHRGSARYFEWVRTLEAFANGCVVVSEHSDDVSPLIPGEHFISGRVETLALLADGLLRDGERIRALRLAAYDFIRAELTMAPAVNMLIELAERVCRGSRNGGRRTGAGPDPEVDGGDDATATTADAGDDVAHVEKASRKRRALDEITRARRLQRIEVRRAGVDPDTIHVVAETRGYSRAEPRVSVVVPLYNHAGEVGRALQSVAACDFDPVEVVVLDDGSTDGSADVVREFFARGPGLPGLLLRHPVNRGLGPTRNHLVEHARGAYVLALDADNEIFPPAISRLVAVLDEDPAAFFAYPMLQVHEEGRPLTLRSHLPWEPGRLRQGNYIDALALLRREQLIAIGGYTEDHRLYGWEDYDLWCRCAERGLRGVLVPQILGRYAYTDRSMLAVTDLDWTDAKRLLRARHPGLLGDQAAGGSEQISI